MISAWRVLLAPAEPDEWDAPRVFRPEDFGDPADVTERMLDGCGCLAAALRGMAEEPGRGFILAAVSDRSAGDMHAICWSPLLSRSVTALPSEGTVPAGRVVFPGRTFRLDGSVPPGLVDAVAVRPLRDMCGDIPRTPATGTLAGVPARWLP